MINQKLKIILHFTLSFCVLIFAFCVLANEAQAAASLYLSPPSGTYTIGSTFPVKVKVNSGGETINAAEGTLIFNSAELQMVKISKSGSIFSLWTREPSFSNSSGNISFGGGTPDNFTGSSGTIITITFKAKTNASAKVSFSSGSVLAADGKGTNVLANMNGGFYTFKPASFPKKVPAAPVISSTTHPNSKKWYSNNSPKFSWKISSDVTAVKLLINKTPASLPSVFYDFPIAEKKLEELLDDGIWYFHIRFKNKYGWGGITHRKVLIDTESPEPFEIIVDNKGDSTNPTPILDFRTTDSTSGLDYYEVKIDEKDTVPITAADVESDFFKMPVQTHGRHTIIVKAFDMAGNLTTAAADITIEPIELPIITDFPQTVQVGDILTIKGTSQYPNVSVTVFVKKEGEEPVANNVKTGDEGNWLFIYDKSLDKGTYQVWAKITDYRGAQSNLTEKITIAAVLPSIIKFGEMVIACLAVIITLVALIIVLIFIILYARYRIFRWRKRISKETKDAEKTLRIAFKTLSQELQNQVRYFDKKPKLSKREKEVRDKLQKALDTSEKFISKEIKDIKKELE
ncbi:hypothetical protein KAW43_00545 [Candidatus Parcubacteria bacterium]|nr:hypothetical protein [Candidatus Parcubacteria bacterium]